MRRIITLLMIMLLFFIYLSSDAADSTGAAQNQLPPNDEIKNILKKVSPSIVKVVSENHKRYIATGIVIDSDHVISSTKVANHPYETLYVETTSGEQYDAEVLGKDAETSLLLLKINERTLPPIPAISRANALEVGDWVALVGVFYQEFPSIFQGYVSSSSDDRLILNAPVAPGSSGGAVVNKKGELIGVVRGLLDFTFSPDYTYRDQSYEFFIQGDRASNKDLCYAVPMPKVMSIVKDLQKYGKIMRGWLGVSLVGREKNGGTIINGIVPDSPAEKAGFRIGDKILAIKNKPVKSGTDVMRIVRALKPGDNITVEYARGNTKKSTQVIIREFKEHLELAHAMPHTFETDNRQPVIPEIDNTLPRVENFVVNFSGARNLGVDVMTLTPELAQKFNIKEGSGLLISKVYPWSAAEKSGFQAADIITRAGGKTMKQNIDLRRALSELKDNQPIAVEVYREGKLKTFNVVPTKNTNQSPGQYFDMLEMMDRLNEIKIKMNAENKKAEEEVKQLQIERMERKKLQMLRDKAGQENEIMRLRDNEIMKYQQEIELLKKEQALLKNQLEVLKKQLELANKQHS